MMALCPNEIKTHQIVVFQIALEVRKHRRNISGHFRQLRSLWKIIQNLWKLLGGFRKSHS